VLGLIKLR